MGMGWLADEVDITELWPDTLVPLEVFESVSTQWQRAPNGKPIGLRYEVLPGLFDDFGIDAQVARKQMRTDLRVMERAALEVFHGQ